VITPPSQLYEFWKVSPIDLVIFIAGLSMVIFYNIEQGIFATIILSLCVLIFRVFHAHGGFLGKVKVRTLKHENEKWSPASSVNNTRNLFLPLNRKDSSNPDVEIERPEPGIFIYRFSEGFNFPNANSQLDYMAHAVMTETRPTVERKYEKPGDRPWNDYTPRRQKDMLADDNRPILRAIILDFSAVNNVDLTSVTTLVDVREQLDKHAAPKPVQWHLACINSRWTKRALAAAGFGLPSFETENGEPEHFKPIYSLAEMQTASKFAGPNEHHQTSSVVHGAGDSDLELGSLTVGKQGVASQSENAGSSGPESSDSLPSTMTAVHGINRPFFHPDVQSALVSAMATEELRLAMQEERELDEERASMNQTVTDEKPPKAVGFINVRDQDN
jgi:solute carrier family 26 (sodium-independent sulfate anion transporter), member 11